MNAPTVTDELKFQLKNAKLENKHLNAVNQELQDMLNESKRSAIEASGRAGNAQIQLDHALAHLAVLKLDMVLLKPDYDLSALGNAHGEMYHARASDQLAKVLLSIEAPEAWQLIKDSPSKVVRNLMDIRTGLTAELETGLANFSTGDGVALLQVIGKSAADILHR